MLLNYIQLLKYTKYVISRFVFFFSNYYYHYIVVYTTRTTLRKKTVSSTETMDIKNDIRIFSGCKIAIKNKKNDHATISYAYGTSKVFYIVLLRGKPFIINLTRQQRLKGYLFFSYYQRYQILILTRTKNICIYYRGGSA